MNVIERSEFRAQDGSISIEQRLQATLRFGLSWYADMQGQDFVTQRLRRSLGKDHILIRNLTLPGTTTVLPLILLGPQGVQVLLATSVRGVFRADETEWLKFDATARIFRRSQPNLSVEVTAQAHALFEFLKDRGYTLPDVEAVLMFTNPRTHVDLAQPSIRIVLADAIDHFAANLLQFPEIMSKGDIDLLLAALLAAPPAPPPVEEALPGPRRAAPAAGIPPPKQPSGPGQGIRDALRKSAQELGLTTSGRRPRRAPVRKPTEPMEDVSEIEGEPEFEEPAQLPPWRRGAAAKPPQEAQAASRSRGKPGKPRQKEKRGAAAKPTEGRAPVPPASGTAAPAPYAMTYISAEPERAARQQGLSGCQVFLLFLFALVLVVVVGVVSYVLLGGTLPPLPPLPPINLPF